MDVRVYELMDLTKRIKSIKLNGISVNILEERINEIDTYEEEYLYRGKVNELNILIDNYDKFSELLLLCNKVSDDIPLLPSEELNQNIDKVLNLIEQLEGFGIVWENNLNFTKRIYKIVFDIMLEEFMRYNTSKIWDYFKQDNINKKHFNEIIKIELNTIAENSHIFGTEPASIIEFANLKKIEVIKDIINYFCDEELKEEANSEANRIVESIKINDNDLQEKKDEKEKIAKKLEIVKKKLKQKKKDLLIRFTSITLSFGILFGGTVLIKNSIEKKNTKKYYKGIINSYSELYGHKEETQMFEVVDNPKSNTVVNEYGLAINGNRSFTTYDISSANLDNIEKYQLLNLDNYSNESKFGRYKGVSDLAYSEVIDTEIDNTKIYDIVDQKGFYLSFFIYVLLVLGVIEPTATVVSFLLKNKYRNKSIITLGVGYNIYSFLSKNKNGLNIIQITNYYLKKEDKLLSDLDNLDEYLSDLLERNSKLKEEFQKLYSQYLYLLENKENLLFAANLESGGKNSGKKLIKE